MVTAASQWLHATTGRIATCPHSWMQAVHWIAGSGLYTPPRTHGPKWGPTTIAIAQELSALKECRPGIDYLARKLKVSERTVQYHLGMLREAGLLVYRSKGTRISGVGGRASVFERIIPAAFDNALGIRTTGKGATRRPVGAAPEHRSTLGKLAKKAARKVRRRPRRTPVSGRGRCTPMQGGTSGISSAAGTHYPSEAKLASGQEKSPTGKQSKRAPKKLNKVGRRYQLGREATTTIPWLHGASVPRISWVLSQFADAGWTVREVQAVAESIPLPAYGVKRPSGMLADRLRGKAGMTKTMRAAHVAMWEESRAAEKARHTEVFIPAQQGPASVSVRELMAEAVRRTHEIATGPIDDTGAHEIQAGEVTTLEDLDAELVAACRADALRDPSVITDALSAGMPEQDVRRLYTSRLVDQALTLERLAARNLTPAF
ncbi:winged helix-turn-helix domain-containing protein [Streptomyces sp. NPDC101117]|uniref:helix-turn-helix domain-containing protein n=1 Tax=Streptomyces sp. NPDC101117 TaxID=3366108 RepID=UPI0037F25D14